MPNKDDQNYVRSHLPDTYDGLFNMLPTLGEQEAILVGEGAIHPMRIRFNDLASSHRPRVAPDQFSVRLGQGRAWQKLSVQADTALARLVDINARCPAGPIVFTNGQKATLQSHSI